MDDAGFAIAHVVGNSLGGYVGSSSRRQSGEGKQLPASAA